MDPRQILKNSKNKPFVIFIAAIILLVAFSGSISDYFLNNGIENLEKQNYEGAIQDFRWALSFNHDNDKAFFYRGSAEWMKRDSTKACKDWKKGSALGSEDCT